MRGRRFRPVPLAAALLAAAAPSARAVGREDRHAAQAKRAEELMEALYADHTDAATLAECRTILRECLEAGNYRTAKYLSGQMVFHDPESLPTRYEFVRILRAKGDEDEAARELRELVAERPSEAPAYRMLADLHAARGRPREALEVLDLLLRERPGDAASLDRRARILLWDLRDLEGARAEAARMRAAAAGADAAVAAWLRRNAGDLEATADRLAAEREALRAASARLQRLLWGAMIAFAALLGAAGWMTRTGSADSP